MKVSADAVKLTQRVTAVEQENEQIAAEAAKYRLDTVQLSRQVGGVAKQ